MSHLVGAVLAKVSASSKRRESGILSRANKARCDDGLSAPGKLAVGEMVTQSVSAQAVSSFCAVYLP